MKRRDVLFLLAAAAALPHRVLAKNFADDERVLAFIEYLHKEHAFIPTELNAFFARLSYNDKVLRLVGVPTADAEKKPPKKVYWRQYRKQRLTPKKIAAGINFYSAHNTPLQRAQDTYGVPAAVITAIIGIETHYGRHTGSYSVAQTLATLGFGHPQRGQEFLDELTEFLLYAREARIDPLSVSGSYAGAIGMGQFMPSSVRKFAVNSDGDARIDLFSAEDVIASIGNFLKLHGWRNDVGITYPARIDSAQAKQLVSATSRNGYKAVMTHTDLNQYSVHTPAPALADARYVFVDLENRYDTEYRVGTENFYALTRYNKSFKYAAVVTDLAAAIQQAIPPQKNGAE